MKATNGWQKSFASFTALFTRRHRKYLRRDVMGIKVRNFIFDCRPSGDTVCLHARMERAIHWPPVLHASAIAMDTQTIFMYVWHIITAENLIFGFIFILCHSKVNDQRPTSPSGPSYRFCSSGRWSFLVSRHYKTYRRLGIR